MTRRFYAAGILCAALLPAAAVAQPKAQPCFTIAVEVKIWSADGTHNEDHRFQGTYRPGRMGDIGIYTSTGTQESCNIAVISAGETHRFFLTDLRGVATGRDGTSSGTARQDGITAQDKDSYVTITRKEKGATLEFSASSPLPGSDQCPECFGATSLVTFAPYPNVFELSEDDLKNVGGVTKSVALTARKDEYGFLGSGKATLNTKLTPPEEEMIFVPSDSYDTWIPAPLADLLPGITVTPSASRLRVTVKIQPKKAGGEARQDKIQFELQDVTRHKGRTGNYPRNGSEKDDLRFAAEQPSGVVVDGPKSAHTTDEVSEATVVIEAMDTAAWGKLTAKAPALDLKAIYKPTNTYALTIPRDDDGNKIADAWEKLMQLPPQPNVQADAEKVAGQERAGDGMTVLDEYRGLVVLMEGSKVLRRFNPLVKEMFVIDPAGLFDFTSWKKMTQIEAYKVDESMIAGGSDDVASRVVNFNTGDASQSKYAVRLVKLAPNDDSGGAAANRMGFTDCGYCRSNSDCDKCKSPKDARTCNVIPERPLILVNRLYMDLGKALADPTSEEAAGMAAAGIPPFLARRALDALRDPAARNALAQKLLAQVVIHEVGHAVSLLDHSVDPPKGMEQTVRSCPMYYPGPRAYWRFTVFQILFKADATLAMQYSDFCRGMAAYRSAGYDCFMRINVADW
jgi:hypothetical protein